MTDVDVRGLGPDDWQQVAHPGTPTVLSVKMTNSSAHALYRRHGFIDAGASADDPTELVMRR